MISNRYSLRPLAIAIVLSGLVSAPAGAETGEQYTRSLVAQLEKLRAERPDVLAQNRQTVVDVMAAAPAWRRALAVQDNTNYAMSGMMDRARGGLNLNAAFGRFNGEHGNDFMNRGSASPGRLHEYGKSLNNMPRPCSGAVGITSLFGCSGSSSYPSGHTAKATGAALLAAYLVPEKFQAFITRAQEYGESRIVAGQHYPLDVMAARAMTYKAVADLLAQQAPDRNSWLNSYVQPDRVRQDLVNACGGQTIAACAGARQDSFSDRAANKAYYDRTTSYGFKPIGATDKPMEVPENAEHLLATRFGYLSAEQRREVIRTTAYASGGVLDDPWSRINLFAAADGYSAFNGQVVVNQNAALGGFHANDAFLNDIGGSGGLTHLGTGTLTIGGNNSYSGGTIIDGGTIVSGTTTALGTGDVSVGGDAINAGTLLVGAGGLSIGGDYSQNAFGSLLLSGFDGSGFLDIAGRASLDGLLIVSLKDLSGGGMYKLLGFGGGSGRFSRFRLDGLGTDLRGDLVYRDNGVFLSIGAVPEPATWAMMIVGFGMVGGAARYRRRRTTASIA